MLGRKSKKQTNTRNPTYERQNSPVFSYYAQRPRTDENAARTVTKSKRDVRAPSSLKYAPSIIAGLIIVISLIYATTLSTTPRVVSVTPLTSNITRGNDYYEAAISKRLKQSIFNRSKLTINTVGVAEDLEKEFPELSNVSISLPLLGRKPVVQIQPVTPAMILASQQGSFLVDSNGKAILAVKDAGNTADNLTTVTDESGIDAVPGKILIPKDNVAFITTVLYQLNAAKVPVQTLTLPAISNELHVRLSGQSYYVKFNLKGDALQQVGTFLATKSRLESEGGLPGEYIDVRVEDRAYVK